MSPPILQNPIGGERLEAASGKTILNLNSADNSDVAGSSPASQAADLALAEAAPWEAL